jgi:DNA-binding CsgD family transcriptional regulator
VANEQQRSWNSQHDLSKSLPGQRARRLTPQQIDEVRQALTDGASPQDLAAQYGVSIWTIRRYKAA